MDFFRAGVTKLRESVSEHKTKVSQKVGVQKGVYERVKVTEAEAQAFTIDEGAGDMSMCAPHLDLPV